MIITLIIISAIIYYITGWYLCIKLYDVLDDEFLFQVYTLFSLVGLGIIPIIHYIITYHKIYKIPCKIYEDGLINYHGYLCYNISELNYRGQINRKIESLSYTEMQVIIDKLNKWGKDEELKNARIKAIKETKLLIK